MPRPGSLPVPEPREPAPVERPPASEPQEPALVERPPVPQEPAPVERPSAPRRRDPGSPQSRKSGSPARPLGIQRRLSPGRTAAAAALRRLGTPYAWGGGSGGGPTRGGFDCSGLALHAWSKAGVRLAHYTGSQFRQGRRVPFSRLRAGDLVFFGGGSGDPTHVGVYLKDGTMVHAPKTGDVVRTVDFADSPYYRARYRGAVRPSVR
ncbi:C40 family peptidase [Planomonospora sp. ID82291]|nr:C40 family peptidase [Planomonospora sp. ID82291]